MLTSVGWLSCESRVRDILPGASATDWIHPCQAIRITCFAMPSNHPAAGVGCGAFY
jgi:hypothetical protein